MRSRHKAQYAAHERAHLAPSMLHIRRDRWLPGAHPNQVQPTLLQIRTQNLQTKAREMKTKLLQPTACQVCRRLCVLRTESCVAGRRGCLLSLVI
ncbi:hypothetical protein CesoFtcFv8_019745 [Champsocephalus esox]|uniref:Uncharacterized protein n=1 Tax=Champsocephalus esox TaxID=159716 RepID=A0AAN8BF81_9TELE|nr:hypothetical protein CesoFtcFv8_019745 [Champsocephalus esox]